jgi:hypothetical protein
MKTLILPAIAVGLLFSMNGFAKDYESIADFEAGTKRSEVVASNSAVKAMTKALSKQPSIECHLETLPSNVSGPKVLVGFFTEEGVGKFVVGINCVGSEEMGDERYDLVGILGDGGILIESLERNRN